MHKSASPVLLNRHPDNWDSNVIMQYPGFLESSNEQDKIFVRIISEVVQLHRGKINLQNFMKICL